MSPPPPHPNLLGMVLADAASGRLDVLAVPGVEGYELGLATFRAACERWPGRAHHFAARRAKVIELGACACLVRQRPRSALIGRLARLSQIRA